MEKKRTETPLRRALEEYIDAGWSRLHMPGHKGAPIEPFGPLAAYDLTEVEGTDSLFEDDGPLKELEEIFTQLYGTRSSVISAGGSTLCIQAMLRLVAREGGKVIAGRNIHAAAVNAMALLGLEPVWVYPQRYTEERLIGRIAPADVAAALQGLAGAPAEVVYVRDGVEKSVLLTAVKDSTTDSWRTGMWVRDSSAGVGTLTFVDLEKGVFAGLGHPISDGDTGESIALRSGEIVPCEITGCSMGTVGSPGELKGKFLSAHAIGSIRINGENGVYGTTRTGFSGQTMPVAFAQEVETGDAQILATVSGETPRTYHVRIEKISDADPRHNMVVRVVDKALLTRTGGIVQGMSGSPILQNGRLVGAVTHVLVNDPTRGYGIFAQTMLEQAEQVATAEK